MSQDETDPFVDQGPASPHQNRADKLFTRMDNTIQEIDQSFPPEERQHLVTRRCYQM
jgi:hypothetical protein